ncbi:MipA/OmpV family protein [Lysobacter enzymogenes]|uniref:MipA/OmpV family protein n=1 Tax=Lysobacter enzymogenes TaxID=69 RepID=UPI001A970166|nr:MipA/OmpV family protein [Lysobacter enzymogenes]QQP98166.1 MipA/OmpV family protein [Lysobacter enzymogenes]
MLKFFPLALLFAAPSMALAQSPSSAGDLLAEEADDRWNLGLALSVSDSAYAGEDLRPRPFPLVSYEGERFFWRGLSGGVHAIRSGGFTLDVIVSARFDGFDIDDLGRRELAANGLDADRLDDRDDAFDAGLAASWKGRAGEFKLRALADASGTHDGYELSADYAYPVHLGRSTLVPSLGARWLSKDLANYYYGTLDSEVARGVKLYRPGSALVPQVGLGWLRPLGEKWRLFGSVEYKFLPNEIKRSPLIDPDVDGEANLKFGFSRSF